MSLTIFSATTTQWLPSHGLFGFFCVMFYADDTIFYETGLETGLSVYFQAELKDHCERFK